MPVAQPVPTAMTQLDERVGFAPKMSPRNDDERVDCVLTFGRIAPAGCCLLAAERCSLFLFLPQTFFRPLTLLPLH